jgi:alpha-amylase
MGADETEEVTVLENAGNDRNHVISGEQQILAWTKFTYPGRAGKYSDLVWDASFFDGVDWDENQKRKGIYLFQGKSWSKETDTENQNFDYLMGADLDFNHPATREAVSAWGKWYIDTVQMDGFRLDAVKHISHEFYETWINEMREYSGRDFFVVGEYWVDDLQKLHTYLDETKNAMSLFDVPLHFAFYQAATSNGNFDMGAILCDTLLGTRPERAVTFVDNHDTQPGQALCSFVPAWFKPLAYALILLTKDGLPCVFYGDYYGLPQNRIAPVSELKTLLKLRKQYAYGEEHRYFDHHSVVGFTRTGDTEHADSGLAVLMTDSLAGQKRMYVGTQFAGQEFYDALGNIEQAVLIDEEGYGEFQVNGGSVSVWVKKAVYQKLWLE